MTIREELNEQIEDAVILTEEYYDGAIIGITTDDRVVYAFTKMVDALAAAEHLSQEQAQEYIEYNILRAIPYLGEKAPLIIHSFDEER